MTENELREALRNKFSIDKPMDMSIYTMKQNKCESTQDFLRRLEGEILKSSAKVSGDVQTQIALNGMDRAIGSAISTHAPKNLDEVKRLCNRMGVLQQDVPVAQATLPTKLETTMEVLTAAVAQLSTKLDGIATPQTGKRTTDMNNQECSRCGGRCFSSSSCKAMGKTCYKCKKLIHFGNKCRQIRVTDNGQQGNPRYQNDPRMSNGPRPRYGYQQ